MNQAEIEAAFAEVDKEIPSLSSEGGDYVDLDEHAAVFKRKDGTVIMWVPRADYDDLVAHLARGEEKPR